MTSPWWAAKKSKAALFMCCPPFFLPISSFSFSSSSASPFPTAREDALLSPLLPSRLSSLRYSNTNSGTYQFCKIGLKTGLRMVICEVFPETPIKMHWKQLGIPKKIQQRFSLFLLDLGEGICSLWSWPLIHYYGDLSFTIPCPTLRNAEQRHHHHESKPRRHHDHPRRLE